MYIYFDVHGKPWETAVIEVSDSVKKETLSKAARELREIVPVITGRLKRSIIPIYTKNVKGLGMVYYGPQVIERRNLMSQVRSLYNIK